MPDDDLPWWAWCGLFAVLLALLVAVGAALARWVLP
jgi:hypothetical protein